MTPMSRSISKARNSPSISIGITQGEPSGISPEIIVAAIKKISPDKTLNIKIISGPKTISIYRVHNSRQKGDPIKYFKK